MGLTLNDTPSAERTHIAFFGKMNSGKSSLVNALAGQEVSIVSDVCGTTTDPVKKPMEIHGIGPCVLIDTAGFDDGGSLGGKRVEQAKQAAAQADLAVLIFADEDFTNEKLWYDFLQKKNTPVVLVVNKTDCMPEAAEFARKVEAAFQKAPLLVSAVTKEGIGEFKQALIDEAPGKEAQRFITGDLLQEEDVVLLVMPQDIQAPKGRLILPQVQTLRELLDKKCIVMCVTTDKLDQALAALKKPPKLMITDSQVYKTVYDKKPQESRLTSFSTLFAAYKGDIRYFVEGAQEIGRLTPKDHVLIAECCTHAPLDEDIGRVKLPRLLRSKVGEGLSITVVSGQDFPKDLSKYRLVIQCGACMFNRKYVMARVDAAKGQGTAMTNYGVAIAYLNGILDKVEIANWQEED